MTAVNAETVKLIAERSDERLEYIKERFDDVVQRLNEGDREVHSRISRVEARLDDAENKTLLMKRLWIPFALTVVMAVGGLVKAAYLDVIVDQVKAMERRIGNVENSLRGLATHNQPK
jgi:hypothetical protein